MDNWILTLFIISTILACWVFSFVVRFASEIVARKRKRLKSERNRRAIVYALIAMALGSFGSILSAWFAIDIALRMDDELERGAVVIAISLGLFAFALMLSIWAAIGDRSRGRLRCPRCWYNMEGIDTPQCPECGKVIKSERHLRRSRRARWPIALILLFFGVAWYGAASAKFVDQSDDYFALVPTWLLMLGWEHLPEDWILEDNSPFESSLQARLDGSWDFNQSRYWISLTQQRRFARKLCSGILTDRSERWDPRRNELLETLSYGAIVIMDSDGRITGWHAPPVDATALLVVSATDCLDAWKNEHPNELDTQISMTSLFGQWDDQPSPYALARDWIEIDAENNWEFVDSDSDEEIKADQSAYNTMLNSAFATALEPLSDRLTDPSFGYWINIWDDTISMNALMIVDDADVFRFHWRSMLDQTGLDEKRSNFDRSRMLSIFSEQLSEHDMLELYQELCSMLASDSVTAVNHALEVAFLTQRFNNYNELIHGQIYDTCIENVISKFLDDDTLIHPDSDYSSTRRQYALGMFLHHDRTGVEIYPLIREHVVNYPEEDIYLPYMYDPDAAVSCIDAWVDNFADFVTSKHVHVRDWLARNIPVQRGTPHDELIDSIVLRLLDDENEDVMNYARDMIEARSISIPDTDDDE